MFLFKTFVTHNEQHITRSGRQWQVAQPTYYVVCYCNCNEALKQQESKLSYYDLFSVGWKCKTCPKDHVVSEFEFDVVIGAEGKGTTLQGTFIKVIYYYT